MEHSIPNHSKRTRTLTFGLLLLYSLLPGLYKIVGLQALMALSVPILAFLVYCIPVKISFQKCDWLFMIYLLFILGQSVIYMIFPVANRVGIALGLFMNVVPMVGYFFAGAFSLEELSRPLLRIIAIHALLGILLYPAFGITSATNSTVSKLLDGVAFLRMASVSGSLGFGNMMMIGFILSFFYDKRYLPLMLFCLIFSNQRSAWIGSGFAVIIYCWEALRSVNFANLAKIFMGIILSALLFYIVAIKYLKIDFDFVLHRLNNLNSATSERSDMWVDGLENFANAPWGVGLGQVGQIATRAQGAQTLHKLVPDGEYVRIISESGIIGGIFIIGVVFVFIVKFVRGMPLRSEQTTVAIIGGMLVQMLGSNVHEFYFTNFVLWIFIGYFLKETSKL